VYGLAFLRVNQTAADKYFNSRNRGGGVPVTVADNEAGMEGGNGAPFRLVVSVVPASSMERQY